MKRLTIFAALACVACGPTPDMPMRKQSAAAKPAEVVDNPRVEVVRIGVFEDDLAYENRRGVYLVTDKETGQSFIGISGVGITEVGSHSQSTGKTVIRRPDER